MSYNLTNGGGCGSIGTIEIPNLFIKEIKMGTVQILGYAGCVVLLIAICVEVKRFVTRFNPKNK